MEMYICEKAKECTNNKCYEIVPHEKGDFCDELNFCEHFKEEVKCKKAFNDWDE